MKNIFGVVGMLCWLNLTLMVIITSPNHITEIIGGFLFLNAIYSTILYFLLKEVNNMNKNY